MSNVDLFTNYVEAGNSHDAQRILEEADQIEALRMKAYLFKVDASKSLPLNQGMYDWIGSVINGN